MLLAEELPVLRQAGSEVLKPTALKRMTPMTPWFRFLAARFLPKAYGNGVASPANPTFGTPTFAGAARQFQLSAKLRF
jgi:hypothetical protein